ncbi:transcriptional coactivator yorkie isoform X1 [Condylostylus longicornis]|uniref:transcriptional coactivator yorkie isoform X1 n=1 Tax=Condylostylus longicornis TaxID=2530218 RepID=UPI00244E3EF7|nr:transcriptional coactivator yorkie isoform X1 [Condylostylus longicornis]
MALNSKSTVNNMSSNLVSGGINSDTDSTKTGNLVVRIDQDSDDNLQALFDTVLKPENSKIPLQKPLRMRNLPNSFFNPPSGSKTPSVSHSRANSTDSAFSTGSQNNNPPHPPLTPMQNVTRQGLVISHSRAHSSPASLQQTFAGLNNTNNKNVNTVTSNTVPANASTQSAVTTNSENLQQQINIPVHSKQRSYDVVSVIQLQNELGDLPEGWEQARTPEGQIYYLNHNTKTTQWEDPRTQKIHQPALAQISQSSVGAKESSDTDLGPLPPGWEKAVTYSGETYFINHNNRTTSWFDPRITEFLGQRANSICRTDTNSLANNWVNIRNLEKEREYLKQRQQEIQHQDLLTRQNQQTMGLQMDPFLSAITDHTRQESADSGLSLTSNNFSLNSDFLQNIDDSMDCLNDNGNLDSLTGLDGADNLVSSLQLGNNLNNISDMLTDVQGLMNTTNSPKGDNLEWYKI